MRKKFTNALIVGGLGTLFFGGLFVVSFLVDSHKRKDITSKLAPNAVYCDGDSHRIDISNFYSEKEGGIISTVYIKASEGAEYYNLEKNNDSNIPGKYKFTFRGR